MDPPDRTASARFFPVDFPPDVDWRLALDAGGTRLAVSWQDAEAVRVFAVGTGRVLAHPREFRRASGVAFLATGELLVTAFGGCYRCPLGRGKRVLLSEEGWQTCLAVSPGGDLMALGTSTGLEVRSLATGQSNTRSAGNGLQYGRWATFSPGGRFVAAEFGNEADRQPSLVAVWDARTGRRQRVYDTEAHALAFQGDSLNVALADDHGQILLYEADQGEEPTKKLPIPAPWTYVSARALQFRDEGRTLAVLLWDGHFLLLDSETGQVLRHAPPPEGRPASAAVPSADWAAFAAATEGGVVVWPGDQTGAAGAKG